MPGDTPRRNRAARAWLHGRAQAVAPPGLHLLRRRRPPPGLQAGHRRTISRRLLRRVRARRRLGSRGRMRCVVGRCGRRLRCGRRMRRLTRARRRIRRLSSGVPLLTIGLAWSPIAMTSLAATRVRRTRYCSGSRVSGVSMSGWFVLMLGSSRVGFSPPLVTTAGRAVRRRTEFFRSRIRTVRAVGSMVGGPIPRTTLRWMPITGGLVCVRVSMALSTTADRGSTAGRRLRRYRTARRGLRDVGVCRLVVFGRLV